MTKTANRWHRRFLDYMIPGATEVPDVRCAAHGDSIAAYKISASKGMGEGGAPLHTAPRLSSMPSTMR